MTGEKVSRTQRQDEITQELANEFIKGLKEGQLPWTRGFDPVKLYPHNPASGTQYQGTSKLILLFESYKKGYEDPRWMTFNQAKQLGASVMRGEKATWCTRWQPIEVTQKDHDGNPMVDLEGNELKKQILIPCPYAVFNVKQIKGLELPPLEVAHHEWDPNARAEQLIASSKAVIINEQGVQSAFYRPHTDDIHMPNREQFYDASHYYGTLLHELCHWTGHPSRLNRFGDNFEKAGHFGTPDYAREELRAEIGSSILCAAIGVNHDLSNNKAYINSWIQKLESDPKEILYASAQSDKIVTYLRQYDPVKEVEPKALIKENQQKLDSKDLPKIKETVKESINERIDFAVAVKRTDRIFKVTDEHALENSAGLKLAQEGRRYVRTDDGRDFVNSGLNGDWYEVNSQSHPNVKNIALLNMPYDNFQVAMGRQPSLADKRTVIPDPVPVIKGGAEAVHEQGWHLMRAGYGHVRSDDNKDFVNVGSDAKWYEINLDTIKKPNTLNLARLKMAPEDFKRLMVKNKPQEIKYDTSSSLER